MYTILLADDDYFFRGIVQKYYTQKSNYYIIAVSDGEEALSVLNKRHIDAAILDFHLPHQRADQILNKLKAENLSVSSIVVTGDRTIETELIIRRSKAEYFFVKPVDLLELDLALNEIVIKKRVVSF